MREAISQQIWFETTRVAQDGSTMWQKNKNHTFLADRLSQEVQEFKDAVVNEESPRDQTMEAIDIMIFCTSLLAHLAVEQGISLKEIQRMIQEKLMTNEKKYSVENFAKSETVDDAIALSRELWKRD